MKYKIYKSFTEFLLDNNFNINKYKDVKIVNYPCLICNKQFKRKDNYERHYTCVHRKSQIYKCLYCYKEITRNDNFKKHELKCKKQLIL